MLRSVILQLAEFPNIPPSLIDRANGNPFAEIDVDLKAVCHHMFLDNCTNRAPNPNPLALQAEGAITKRRNLQFRVWGLGSHKEVKSTESMKWGKAMCRWFLSRHCHVRFFAHMDHVIEKSAGPSFSSVRISRSAEGDTPDYLCATNQKVPYLAEAKGRQTGTIAFKSKEFGRWRDQLQRVEIRNTRGRLIPVKGFIAASRLAVRGQLFRPQSRLLVEDPVTAGNDPMGEEESLDLSQIALSHHYASILDKLNLSYHANALRERRAVSEESQIRVGVWKCVDPTLRNLEFVEGFYPFGELEWFMTQPFRWRHYYYYYGFPESGAERLPGVFFGLEKSIFQSVLKLARSTTTDVSGNLYEGIEREASSTCSFIQDGTLLAPPDAMQFVGVETL